jgi:hypothetical protein
MEPNRDAVRHWLDAYDTLSAARSRLWLHTVAVVLLEIGVVALLWAVPVPAAFTAISPALNWGSAFLLATVVYYFLLSLPVALALLPAVFALAAAVAWLDRLPGGLGPVGGGLIAMAVLLDLAAAREKRPATVGAFLQLVMIAPVWWFHRFLYGHGD